MNFIIMRHKKLKSILEITQSLNHTFREIETPNANPNIKNNHFGDSKNSVLTKIKSMLPEKRRKDAVLTIEYLITASPEWWKKNQDKHNIFFETAVEYLVEKYGSENLVHYSIHYDETTPHLVAYVLPIKDGKLNAKYFIGSPKILREEQTKIAEKFKKLGLERGIKGSKAKHEDIKRYYADLNKTLNETPKEPVSEEDLEPKKKGLIKVENKEEIKERLNRSILNKFQEVIALASLSRVLKNRVEALLKNIRERDLMISKLNQTIKNLKSEVKLLNQINKKMKEEIYDDYLFLSESSQKRVLNLIKKLTIKEQQEERQQEEQERVEKFSLRL